MVEEEQEGGGGGGVFYEILWNFMKFYEILWNFMADSMISLRYTRGQ